MKLFIICKKRRKWGSRGGKYIKSESSDENEKDKIFSIKIRYRETNTHTHRGYIYNIGEAFCFVCKVKGVLSSRNGCCCKMGGKKNQKCFVFLFVFLFKKKGEKRMKPKKISVLDFFFLSLAF
jgi:hypothetical protein